MSDFRKIITTGNADAINAYAAASSRRPKYGISHKIGVTSFQTMANVATAKNREDLDIAINKLLGLGDCIENAGGDIKDIDSVLNIMTSIQPLPDSLSIRALNIIKQNEDDMRESKPPGTIVAIDMLSTLCALPKNQQKQAVQSLESLREQNPDYFTLDIAKYGGDSSTISFSDDYSEAQIQESFLSRVQKNRAIGIKNYPDGYGLSDVELDIALEIAKAEISEGFTVAPKLNDLPSMKARFESLGISQKMAEKMLESWCTYDALALARYDNPDAYATTTNEAGVVILALTENQENSLASNQSKAIMYKLKNLEDMISQYGVNNTMDIIDTFGIYNFPSADGPGQKHLATQLENWREGNPIKDILIEPRSDWNNFMTFADSLRYRNYNDHNRVLLERKTIFEAESADDIVAITEKIRDYAAINGHEPDIENFIIHAHGSPTGMVLGPKGQKLNLSLFEGIKDESPKQRQARIETFKKRLGNNFRIILKSCSTAGEVKNSDENLASMLAKTFGAQVVASDTPISEVLIDSSGQVIFQADLGYDENLGYYNYVGKAYDDSGKEISWPDF